MKNSLLEIQQRYGLSEKQTEQYLWYISFLQEENKKYDLTNIDEFEEILSLHLSDTLEITKTDAIKKEKHLVDIGSGAGIPGILLAIFFPEKRFILIEVKKKKIHFLKKAIEELKLINCMVYEKDFQTFVHEGVYAADLFITRASLAVNEITDLLFKKTNTYKKTTFIYFGSATWKEKPQHNKILEDKKIAITEYPYTIKTKKDTRNLYYVSIKKR
jgi:16S rRNA (guanine(527)-N(7))-methyltransferase RsmG